MARRFLVILILFQALAWPAAAESLPGVRFLLSNNAPYLGQEVVLTVEVRYRQRPGGLITVRWPKLDDCVSIDLPAPPPRREEGLDGPLLVESARLLLRPQAEGKRRLNGGIELRGAFIPAPPLSLRVRPLPPGRPADFADAIGAVEMELLASGVGTREIELKLRGNAPLDAFPPPRPRTGRRERLMPLGEALSGGPGDVRERSFRFLYLPGEGRQGKLTFTLPIFDPVAGGYKLLQAGLPESAGGIRRLFYLVAPLTAALTFLVVRVLKRRQPKTIQHLLFRVLGRPPAGLSRDCILAALQKYGVSPATLEDLVKLWETGDRCRFAPGNHISELGGLSDREIQVVRRLANDIDKYRRIP